jgi:hypothetical protein
MEGVFFGVHWSGRVLVTLVPTAWFLVAARSEQNPRRKNLGTLTEPLFRRLVVECGPVRDASIDYDRHAPDYPSHRQADPRIAAHVHAALGDARTVLNVGAGSGSYEPEDRYVLAVEPSAGMRAQRPAHLAPAISARAEALPLDEDAFDAAMAIITTAPLARPRCRPTRAAQSCARPGRRAHVRHRRARWLLDDP